jgi:hypothetical protein
MDRRGVVENFGADVTAMDVVKIEVLTRMMGRNQTRESKQGHDEKKRSCHFVHIHLTKK